MGHRKIGIENCSSTPGLMLLMSRGIVQIVRISVLGKNRNLHLWRVPIEAADAFLAGDHTELARIAAVLAQAQHRPHAPRTTAPATTASPATAAA